MVSINKMLVILGCATEPGADLQDSLALLLRKTLAVKWPREIVALMRMQWGTLDARIESTSAVSPGIKSIPESLW